jgi:hypothetical protein
MATRFNPGALGTPGTGGSLAQGYTDNSGAPGSTTINTPSGKAAIASAASACTVTCSACLSTSKVFISLLGNDATAVSARVTSINAGNFVVTAVAAATGNTAFDFLVVN